MVLFQLQHTYIYTPKETCITNVLPLLQPKVLVVGEAEDGSTLAALLSFYKESGEEMPSCTE